MACNCNSNQPPPPVEMENFLPTPPPTPNIEETCPEMEEKPAEDKNANLKEASPNNDD
ncbi:hypothetical protein JHK87_014993 [Glycine soja]|nr:hypothetical protein JHK87_014993 [Glycine soja]